MRRILLLLYFVCAISGVLSNGLGTGPDAATCLEKLRTDVEADVTRIVGVFLANNLDTFTENAQVAAQHAVEKERISQGQAIIEPTAAAVETSVIDTFENLSWEIRTSIKVFITTTLKRLCALENCCFN